MLIFMLAVAAIAAIFLLSGFDSLEKGMPIKNSNESGEKGVATTTTFKNYNGYLDQFISEGNSLEKKPTSSSKVNNTPSRESGGFRPKNFIGPSSPPSVVGPPGPPPGY